MGLDSLKKLQNPVEYVASPILLVVQRLPPYMSRWLGYRASPPAPEPTYVSYLWAFIGAFGGLASIQGVFGYLDYFKRRHVPSIIPSFSQGASAILCYGAIGVPLAQPRALLGGHFISALVGVIVSQIFDSKHHPESHWVAASLATAIALVAMQLTGTTHPPAGATALIPIVDAQANSLDWYYIPVVILSSVIVLVTALLTNNIQRRYPTFWYTDKDIRASAHPVRDRIAAETQDEEKASGGQQNESNSAHEESSQRSSTVHSRQSQPS